MRTPPPPSSKCVPYPGRTSVPLYSKFRTVNWPPPPFTNSPSPSSKFVQYPRRIPMYSWHSWSKLLNMLCFVPEINLCTFVNPIKYKFKPVKPLWHYAFFKILCLNLLYTYSINRQKQLFMLYYVLWQGEHSLCMINDYLHVHVVL